MYRIIDTQTNEIYITVKEAAQGLSLSLKTLQTMVNNALKRSKGPCTIECSGKKLKVDKIEKSPFCAHAIALSRAYGKAFKAHVELKDQIYDIANQTGFSPFAVAVFLNEHKLAEVPYKLKEDLFLERPQDP